MAARIDASNLAPCIALDFRFLRLKTRLLPTEWTRKRYKLWFFLFYFRLHTFPAFFAFLLASQSLALITATAIP